MSTSFPQHIIDRNEMKLQIYTNRNVRKRTFAHVRPVKIQISLRTHTVRSESSLGTFWIALDAKFLHADNEDSDQTARMRRLIWVFVGHMYEGAFSDVWPGLWNVFYSSTVNIRILKCLDSSQLLSGG